MDIPLGQNCGGFIDPITLQEVAYHYEDGTNGTVKGYICPLGQICKVCYIVRLGGTLVAELLH